MAIKWLLKVNATSLLSERGGISAKILCEYFSEMAQALVTDHIGYFTNIFGTVGEKGEGQLHSFLPQETIRRYTSQPGKDAFKMGCTHANFFGELF